MLEQNNTKNNIEEEEVEQDIKNVFNTYKSSVINKLNKEITIIEGNSGSWLFMNRFLGKLINAFVWFVVGAIGYKLYTTGVFIG